MHWRRVADERLVRQALDQTSHTSHTRRGARQRVLGANLPQPDVGVVAAAGHDGPPRVGGHAQRAQLPGICRL